VEGVTAAQIPTDRWTSFRTQQRDEIAQGIIDAVSSSSVNEVNVTEVVERVGISRKTFYKYFDDIGAAMVYAQELALNDLSEQVKAAGDNLEHGIDRYLARYDALARIAFDSNLVSFITYFDYVFRRVGLDAAETHDYEETSQTLADSTVSDFLQGQADGSIRADLDPDLTLLAIGTSILGTVQRLMVTRPPSRNPFIREQCIQLQLDVWRRHLTPPST
jgi:AcrR family transcriptional regulator